MKNSTCPAYKICFCLAALFVLSFVGCKEDELSEKIASPYDPSQPVVVTDFTPKTGG